MTNLPNTLSRDEHTISRKLISKAALNVLYGLNEAGYESYLVGGCIRDLLLGEKPKDFDVATNATPEQIKSLFRRSRIVGRRFRIVHVRMGREIIEVTTFRGAHDDAKPAESNEHGMLLRDNVYGNIHEDAIRRDFSVNALYYTVDGFRLLDFTGGLEDIESRTLRILGDPETRFREDPVRMLRAARFTGKLGFELDQATQATITQLRTLIEQVSSARLFDECNKLFLSGYGKHSLESLRSLQLLQPLFGDAANNLLHANTAHSKLLSAALENTDQRLREGKSATPGFLFACILWHKFQSERDALIDSGIARHQATQEASFHALDGIQARVALPRRFSIMIRDIWSLQNTLESANGKRAIRLLTHPRFRAAYDFLLVREQAGEDCRNSDYWTELQLKHPVSTTTPNEATPSRNRHRRR